MMNTIQIEEQNSIPSASDNKFSVYFREYTENNRGLNGGVEFMGFGIGRPPSAYAERIRGTDGYSKPIL